MQIKEIAKFLVKAGISARPKALQWIKDHIDAVEESEKEKESNEAMQDENDMNRNNAIDSKSVITLVIDKFEEMKKFNSTFSSAFLEESTVQAIFKDYFSMEYLQKLSNDQKIEQTSAMPTKSFKNSALKIVKDAIMEEKSVNVEGPVLTLLSQKVIVLDSFSEIPKSRIVGKNLIYENKRSSLYSSIELRAEYYEKRLKFVENWILSESYFQRAKLDSDFYKNNGPLQESENSNSPITFISTVSACLGAEGKIVCLGMLVRGKDIMRSGLEYKSYYLEDASMQVQLELSKATSDKNMYLTERSIVLVEGEYMGTCFHVSYITQKLDLLHRPCPQTIKSALLTNDSFGAFSYLQSSIIAKNRALTKIEFEEMKDESKGEDEGIVIISNLYLDKPENLKELKTIFDAYESMENIWTFIICGEFISKVKTDSSEFDDLKLDFMQLADLIRGYDRLKNKVRFLIVPGPNEPGSDGVLPYMPVNGYFKEWFEGIKNVSFVGNPCRISFFGKQIIISRYNYFKKLKKNAIYLGGDHEEGDADVEMAEESNEFEKIVNTILAQANLSPFSFYTQPLYWDYAEVLNMPTMPDFLILSDTWSQYTFDKQSDFGCTVLNPGNFSTSKTFSLIYPNKNIAEENSLKQTG